MKENYKLKVGKIILAFAFLVFFSDPARAASLSLSWSASPSTNVVGYTVYYGNSTGNYTSMVQVDNKTNVLISGINRQMDYYFAVTARSVDLESLPSEEIVLTAEKNPPQLSITSPINGLDTTNSTVTLAGNASDDHGLAQITWSNNCNQAGGVAAGLTNWTVSNVPLCLGTNVISVTAKDGAGNSAQATIAIVRNNLPPPCAYTISQASLNFPSSGGASNVEVTAGSSCDWSTISSSNWIKITSSATGIGSGIVLFSVETNQTCFSRTGTLVIAGSNVLITQAAGSASIESISGTYSGLFVSPKKSSGLFNLKKGTRTALSGSVSFDGQQYSYSGKFDSRGQATISIKRRSLSSLTLQISLEPCSPDSLFATISDGSWTTSFSAERSGASSYAGKYTIAIETDNAPAPLARGESIAEPEMSPEGIGFATIQVSSNGLIKVSGTLGDGTRIAHGGFISRDGNWPCFVPLYKKTGLISGALQFESDGVNPRGKLTWTKPANVRHQFYPAGFSNSVSVIGSPYSPPTNLTDRVLNFVLGTIILDGNNPEGGLAKDVMLLPDNTILPVHPGEDGLTVKLNKNTGLFTGTIKLPGNANPVKFKGGLLQNVNAGYGLFMNINQSGQLVLESAP